MAFSRNAEDMLPSKAVEAKPAPKPRKQTAAAKAKAEAAAKEAK